MGNSSRRQFRVTFDLESSQLSTIEPFFQRSTMSLQYNNEGKTTNILVPSIPILGVDE
jgi:hypothetical protein